VAQQQSACAAAERTARKAKATSKLHRVIERSFQVLEESAGISVGSPAVAAGENQIDYPAFHQKHNRSQLPRQIFTTSSARIPILASKARQYESHLSKVISMAKTRVQEILDKHKAIVFPGVYDTLSAKLAARAGFPMAFISGYSVAATAIGEPDLGLLTQTELVAQARRVCHSVDIPIIVDADTGYGNPLNVIRTVRDLIDAGAAGCFLEDQQWPKKCGHMRGKRVIEREEYIDKIRAAVDTRGDVDFFIVARTDSLAAVSLDEAIARVTEARSAGADASFVEAPNSLDELAEIGRRAPAPVVANMIEKGKTPVLPKQKLVELGFHLILYPLAGLFAAARGLASIYETIREQDTTLGAENGLMAFDEFNELIGVEEKYRLAERYGVK
jgi:methylisocitrate lyase